MFRAGAGEEMVGGNRWWADKTRQIMLRAGVEVMIPEREIVRRVFHVRPVDAQAARVCQLGGEARIDHVAGMKDQIGIETLDHACYLELRARSPATVAEQRET